MEMTTNLAAELDREIDAGKLSPVHRAALRRAHSLGVPVKLRRLARHWLVVVDGQVEHIKCLPRLINQVLRRRERR